MQTTKSSYKDTVLINYPRKVKVGEVEAWLAQNDAGARERLVEVIHHRLNNRYVRPLENIPTRARSGFLTLAVSCLMIEAFQSFREGRENTRKTGAGVECFSAFFAENEAFHALQPYAFDFYRCIRCGILHQAETYENWRVERKDGTPLFDPAQKVINADKFFKELVKSFLKYCQDLKTSEMDGPLWNAAATKLRAICNHCNVDGNFQAKKPQ